MIKKVLLLLMLVVLTTNINAKSRFDTRRAVQKAKPELIGGEMILPVVAIYDGDTIKSSLTLPPPLNAISVRIQHIDTPGKPAKSFAITGKLGRAKCINEAKLALFATEYLESLQNKYGGAMTVKNFKYGYYAGRIVGDVYIGGINVAQQMIELGYAVKYDGKSARSHNWCD